MSSPAPSTIENVIIPSGDPQDYPISRIFSQLIEPECGRVSPDFLEYQNPGSTDAGGDQEGVSMEADGVGVEVGTAHQGLPQSSSPVSVTTVSNISNVLCAYNRPTEYCHGHKHHVVFVPPPEGECFACNLLQHMREAHEVGIGPLTGYSIGNDDSDKENNPNATEIPPQSQGQGMGSCSRHQGRHRGGRQGVGDAEEGPIRLYHPWQTHLVRVQAGRSTSPIPRFFELNQGPAYIPFLIPNDQGRKVPAKYVSVHMTTNPYTLGKLTSDGPTK